MKREDRNTEPGALVGGGFRAARACAENKLEKDADDAASNEEAERGIASGQRLGSRMTTPPAMPTRSVTLRAMVAARSAKATPATLNAAAPRTMAASDPVMGGGVT